jgi:hypothetical protein
VSTVAPPLVRRRLDYLLLPAMVLGILNSVALSLPEALGARVAPDSPWLPLRSLHTWAVQQEPQHLVMPPALRASLLYDGFVQLALVLVLVVGLAGRKDWPWLRTLALVYAVSAVMNMYFYFMQTFLGPDSPPHLATYLPINLPWLLVPALVAYRFWSTPGQRLGRSGATGTSMAGRSQPPSTWSSFPVTQEDAGEAR